MPRRKRKGFTLVELLVVIAIIGTLVALLLPAVQKAREAANNLACKNNMTQLTLATFAHEVNRGAYPGFVQFVAKRPEKNPLTGAAIGPGENKRASWAVALFPYLERQDIYDLWDDPQVVLTPQHTPYLQLFVCPSSSEIDKSQPENRYAASSGFQPILNPPPNASPDPPPFDDTNAGTDYRLRAQRAANGVFHDLIIGYQAQVAGTAVHRDFRPTVKASDVLDGTSNTILFTENLRAGNWNQTVKDSNDSNIFAYRYITGASAGGEDGGNPPVVNNLTANPEFKINGEKNTVNYNPLRPSANHTRGVNVGFADKHVQFMSDEIDYRVWTQLITPHGRKSDMPNNRSHLLNDSDFQL